MFCLFYTRSGLDLIGGGVRVLSFFEVSDFEESRSVF